MKRYLFSFFLLLSIYSRGQKDTLPIIGVTINECDLFIYANDTSKPVIKKLPKTSVVIIVSLTTSKKFYVVVYKTDVGYCDASSIYHDENVEIPVNDLSGVQRALKQYPLFEDLEAKLKKRKEDILKLYGIGIIDYEPQYSEYEAGFTIRIQNGTHKTIKYVYITTVAYNAVDDVVATKQATGIGPVEYYESVSWDFSDIYFSKIIDKVELTKIIVEFKDGTRKTLSRDQIKKAYL
ncbi:MAG TPA: hypothetical protein PL045_03610 [Chitinophagaceae bacterium]|nr:hypothetical protein [Chitinophagaceae bacterium]